MIKYNKFDRASFPPSLEREGFVESVCLTFWIDIGVECKVWRSWAEKQGSIRTPLHLASIIEPRVYSPQRTTRA